MKNIYIHTLVLFVVGMLMTACEEENWFIHTIEYNGNADKPELVVIGELYAGKEPQLFVSESVFFNDPDHRKKIKKSLSDADVQLTVNDGTPIKLRFVRFTDADYTLNGCYHTYDYTLREGDSLVFTISHPNYEKTARVSLRVPAAPKVDIAFQDTTWGVNGLDFGGLAHWRVGLQPATGRHDSYLIFQSKCYRTFDYLELYYDYNKQPQERHDVDKITEGYTYSKDPAFAECPAINNELGEGYWGAADPLGLYCPTPTAAKEVDVYGYYERTEIREHTYNDGGYYRQSRLTDSIELCVCATSDEQYIYLASLINSGNYYRRFIINFWGNDYEGDFEDIFEGLSSLEGVQIFGNVENAIGHVTAFSHPVRHVIYPDGNAPIPWGK